MRQKRENDQVVTSYLTEWITIIFETHELNALILFQCLLPVLSQSLLAANSDRSCKIFALCTIADFVRYCMQHTYEVIIKNNMWTHVLRLLYICLYVTSLYNPLDVRQRRWQWLGLGLHMVPIQVIEL